MINRTRRSATALMLILSILLTTMPVSSVAVATIDAEALSKESKIFNYIHREVFEENAHVQRLTAEESLDSYVFLNADGSRTAYFLDEQVKFVDANGTVQEKDITLTYAANTFSTTRNNVRLNIPTNLSTGVQLSYGGYDVSIVPQGSSLTLPRRTDNSVVYDNYFGTGTRLIYTPTLDGVKEDIVLTSYRGISSFTFLLNTDGLRVYHTAEDRWYLAEYEEAELRFWLGNVEVYDANLKPSLGIMTVEPIAEGQRYRLTISADPNFLTDPATAYPVTIDPTITVSDTANGAGAIEDAPIYEGYPTSNFGSYQYNRAGYGGTAYKRGRTVVKLTGLLNNSTFSGLTATSLSSVKFYISDATGTGSATVDLYPLRTSWSESTVTWNTINSDSYYANSADKDTTTFSNGAYSYFDITSIVQKWKVGRLNSANGFILIGRNESSADRSLYSSEHSTSSKRPYVELTYYPNNYVSNYQSGDYFRNTPGKEDSLQYYSNCYGYAMRFFTTDEYYFQTPGEFAEKPGLQVTIGMGSNAETKTFNRNDVLNDFVCDDIYYYSESERLEWIYRLMEKDAETLGYTISRIGYANIHSTMNMSTQHLIALVVSDNCFHFYLQHSDGTWSHKDGHSQPTNLCIDCNEPLTNATIDTHAREGFFSPEYDCNTVYYILVTKNLADMQHSDGTAATYTAILGG